MKKSIFSCIVLVCAFLLANSAVVGQTDTAAVAQAEKDLQLLRLNLRADKKKVLAANVPLTETEATKFWPVYDQYAADMSKHYDALYSIIKDYAANQQTLTDAQAISMIKRWSDLQVQVAQTRQRYVPIIEKVIPGKKAALFFQIDRRVYQLIDLQVASEVPLVAP